MASVEALASHATRYPERGGYRSQDADSYLNDGFPSVFFHGIYLMIYVKDSCENHFAVFLSCGITYVQPTLLGLTARLQYHLVKVAFFLDKLHVLLERLLVGDEYVGGLSQAVLASWGTTHGKVELLASETAGDADDAKLEAEGFEYHFAEHRQSYQDDEVGRQVVDALLDGCARADEFAKAEMRSEKQSHRQLPFFLCCSHSITI